MLMRGRIAFLAHCKLFFPKPVHSRPSQGASLNSEEAAKSVFTVIDCWSFRSLSCTSGVKNDTAM